MQLFSKAAGSKTSLSKDAEHKMNKEQARIWGKRARGMLSISDRAQCSISIAEQFSVGISLKKVAHIHCYLAIAAQQEPDTLPLLAQIRDRRPDIVISVPAMKPADTDFFSALLQADDEPVVGPLGMLMPDMPERVDPNTIDLALIPMLAYDAWGCRVGYGGGFYDRFLSTCRPNTLRVGVSFFGSVPEISDAWPGDVKLDAAVTPVGVRWF